MTTAEDPDQIRREIEHTQRILSGDVNALSEKVTPGRIVERRVERIRSRLAGLRDRVMGNDTVGPSRPEPVRSAGRGAGETAAHVESAMADAASSAAQSIADTASGAVDTLQEAPDVLRRQTRGNPLAVGLIAFGTGLLVSSLLPPTRREQELAAQATGAAMDKAGPVAEKVGEVVQDLKDNLREPAQQAVDQVRQVATEAGQEVSREGAQAVGQVWDHAQDAAGAVREEVRG